MANNKKNLTIGFISLGIIAISLVMFILDWALPIGILIHPTLTFVLCLFVGFGFMALVLGVLNKSPFYLFLSGGQLSLAVLYVLVASFPKNWWIGVVVMAVVLMFMAIFSLMLNGNKTESIAENNSKDYKTYSERKEEKRILEESQEEAELPQIKSFKK